MGWRQLTLVAVGDSTFFFFLILMPGMGAELRASRKPRPSMAMGEVNISRVSPMGSPKRLWGHPDHGVIPMGSMQKGEGYGVSWTMVSSQ